MTVKDQSPKPDVAQLMEQIRARVKAEMASSRDKPLAFKPKHLDFGEGSSVKAGELVNSEDLLFLNRNYVVAGLLAGDALVSHRKGFVARVILAAKRKLATVIKDSILSNYLSHEQEFFAHLVRHLNQNSRYVDARDADIFWQLIHKVDTDVGKALERIERIRDELLGATQSVEKNTNEAIRTSIAELNSSLGKALSAQQSQAASLQTMDSVVRGMEGILARLGRQSSNDGSNSGVEQLAELTPKIAIPDLSYVLLENRFRGSVEEIRARQEMYVQYFTGTTKPILDVGCGRGELLELFRQHGLQARGIDIDAAMIAECQIKKLEVENVDLLAYLRKIEDRSLGGLIALQVVEHLPKDVLNEFIALANRKVEQGGVVIFETINPTSMTALSSNYFRDPTHVFPQHPDTLAYVMTLSGFDVVETKFLAPVPDSAQLRELKQDVYMTPRWTETVDLFNHNIRVLNSLLFGFQDFCVVGKVRH